MGKLSYYLKVGQCVTFTCQKNLLWLRGLSDGYRDEPDGLFINRPIPREVQHVGFAKIPFVSDERAERLVYN